MAAFESETTNASKQQRIAKKYPGAQLVDRKVVLLG
jgi:hypothetical protein